MIAAVSEDKCGAHGLDDFRVRSISMDDQERHYIGDLLADDDVFQTSQSSGSTGALKWKLRALIGNSRLRFQLALLARCQRRRFWQAPARSVPLRTDPSGPNRRLLIARVRRNGPRSSNPVTTSALLESNGGAFKQCFDCFSLRLGLGKYPSRLGL